MNFVTFYEFFREVITFMQERTKSGESISSKPKYTKHTSHIVRSILCLYMINISISYTPAVIETIWYRTIDTSIALFIICLDLFFLPPFKAFLPHQYQHNNFNETVPNVLNIQCNNECCTTNCELLFFETVNCNIVI